MTNDDREKFITLLQKYKAGTCTQAERIAVEQAYLNTSQPDALPEDMELVADLLDMQQRFKAIIHPPIRKVLPIRLIASIAAAVMLCLTIGGIYWRKQHVEKEIKESVKLANQILPGKNSAILILDGQQNIELSDGHEGLVSNNGTLTYGDGTALNTTATVQHITLQTPKAGQFEASLPDGTKVWLNAASSISYPSVFEGTKREVNIVGEVYLQVVKDPNKPFIIHTSKQKIEVLGTSFNVEAYADAAVQSTTLQEGSLRISTLGDRYTHVIKPGEKAVISDNSPIEVQSVGIDAIASWKDGVYLIQNLPLADFAHQLARWYDIEVDMGNHNAKKLSAMIPRDVPLATVLQAITLKTQIQFKVKGRRVSAID